MKRKKEKVVKNTSGIALSIGMIVKDEMRCIERCLKSLEPLRKAVKCELIIADTGSTDGTREICEKYADTLIDFEWIDDFSAARNATLDISRGNWYMFIDADEYLDENISELVEFVTHPDAMRKFEAFFVNVRNYTLLDIKNAAYSDFPALRVLRMSTGKRFQNAIHEGFEAESLTNFCKLEKTIFHHDGYANDRNKEAITAKSERNMELLRKKYEKAPENLIIILQCIESCGMEFADERMIYITEGMRLIMENEEKRKEFVAVGIYKHAQKDAFRKNLPVWEQWYEFGKEHFSDSYYFKLEVLYSAVEFFLDKKEYEQALSAGSIYLKSFEEYANSTKDMLELIQSPLVNADEYALQTLQICQTYCHLKMEQKEEALKLLDCISLKKLNDHGAKYMLMAAELMPEEARVQEVIAMIIDEYYDYSGTENSKKYIMAICRVGVRTAFTELERKKFAAYLRCSGDLGVCANIFVQGEKESIEPLLDKIKDFYNLPMPVYKYCIEKGVKFPAGMYNISYEGMLNITNSLANEQELIEDITAFSSNDDFNTSLKKQQFLFFLLTALLKKAKFTKGEQAEHNTVNYSDLKQEKSILNMLEIYKNTAQSFVEKLYSKEVLQSEADYNVLLPDHAFALLFTKAQNALDAGDELLFVRLMRNAVAVQAQMHSVVDFAISKAELKKSATKNTGEQIEVNEEMKQLAIKIKQILNTFPKNSPAVAQLMQSEAYKKVKHIIESEDI